MLCCVWWRNAVGLENRMFRPLLARLLAGLLLLVFSVAACAPPAGMAATLTLLPGTFTPLPPTRAPTHTPDIGTTPTATQWMRYSYPTLMPTLTGSPSPTDETPFHATPNPAASASTCPLPTPDPRQPLPSTPAGFVGQHYDPNALPNGLTEYTTGALMSANYSYAHVKWQGRDLFWIQKLVCQNPSGQNDWEITDVLALPILNPAAHQVISDACFRNSTQVPFVIAYGTVIPNQPTVQVAPNSAGWPMQVTAAWQMTDQFTALDPQGLTCLVRQP